VHADFPAVLAAARAAALQRVRRDRAAVIARQLERLIAPDQMGELFKAAAIWSDAAPPAFEAAE
jgi:SAM-dependent MidA family methyltransferase